MGCGIILILIFLALFVLTLIWGLAEESFGMILCAIVWLVLVCYGVVGEIRGRCQNKLKEQEKQKEMKICNIRITLGSIILSLSLTAFAIVFGTIDQHMPTLQLSCFFLGIIGLVVGVIFIRYSEKNEKLNKVVKIVCILVPVIASVLMFRSCIGMDLSDNRSDNSSTTHTCYVCGEEGNLKYGSFYYCPTHWAMVKTVDEAN